MRTHAEPAQGVRAQGVRAPVVTPDRPQPPAKAYPAPPARRRGPTASVAGVVAAVVSVAAFAVVSALPWEWSFIDDTGMIYTLDRYGLPGTVREEFVIDRGWGLFRPMWWVYVATFYQLPVGPAHAVRVAMLVTAIAAAVVVVVDGARGGRRVTLGAWTLLGVGANGTLFMGVWYPSLQELSGLCAVGLGLFARRRPWLVVVCWLVAAWFKAPFAWLLLAFGIAQLVSVQLVPATRTVRHRAPGLVAVLHATGTLGIATVMARTGTYTRTTFTPDFLYGNARLALTELAGPALVVLVGVLALGARARRDPWGITLLLGGAGYLANLLPWKTDTHYAGPYVYLMTVGALLTVRTIEPRPARVPVAAGLAVAVLLAGVSGGGSLRNGWRTHATVTGLRDCVLRLPPGSLVGYNRVEAWTRLDDIVRRHDPAWTGRIVQVVDGDTGGRVWGAPWGEPLDYYIYQASYGPGTPSLRSGPVVCRTAQASVYRVA